MKLNRRCALKIKWFLSLIIILVSAGFAHGSAESDFDVSKCLDAAGGEHPAMLDCYGRQVDLVSKDISGRLNTEYRDEASARVAKLLQSNQPNWEIYVKGLCAAYLEMGGQRGVLLQASCLENKYQERLKELIFVLEQAEL